MIEIDGGYPCRYCGALSDASVCSESCAWALDADERAAWEDESEDRDDAGQGDPAVSRTQE